MDDRFLTIDSLESLDPLRDELRRGSRRRFNRIRLRLPALSSSENAGWEDRLERGYLACGCAEAGALGAISIVVGASWVAFDGVAFTGSQGLWLLVIFFLATGIGKAIGLARARSRLRADVATLCAVIGNREQHRSPEASVNGPDAGGIAPSALSQHDAQLETARSQQ